MLDYVIEEFDKILKVLTTQPRTNRKCPDDGIENPIDLTDVERKHSLGLMRVNHCGEICAQALYQGQSIAARNLSNQNLFIQAALEEEEHLSWTLKRIKELGGNSSIFNPLFYISSLGLGLIAGAVGDRWNLGFLKETELQVEQHLAHHENILPSNDYKSLAIVTQMKYDEAQHAIMADNSGAAELPVACKQFMKISSKVMTKLVYRI